MKTSTIDELRKRILPVLLCCQANKDDLKLYSSWREKEDASRKLFYTYYSGLFCRILCMIESESVPEKLLAECDNLLNKYNWFDIHEEDLMLFKAAGPHGCEVPDALNPIDGIDNVVWNGSDAPVVYCIKIEKANWSFADVRGSAR